jgi:tetratricopeptide (TPR) repeat protein
MAASCNGPRSTPALPIGLIVMAVLALLVSTPDHGAAQSPLVAELETVARRYHEAPASLDRLVIELERASVADPHPSNFIALSHASFLWAEVRASTREQRLRGYDRGRRAGSRALALAPRAPEAHFWYAMNSARWGQVNGVLRSLFLLPSLRREIRTTLELDPTFTPAYVLSGTVSLEVPRIFGGSLDHAEESFRKALEQDPRLTAARVGLARALVQEGRRAEARQELQAVLDEKAPRSPAEWTLHDTRDARALLAALQADRGNR